MVAAFLCSCKKSTTPTTTNTTPPAQQLPAVVSFSTNIVPIFNSYCNSIGCHAATAPAAGLNLTPASAYGSLMAKHETYTVNPTGSNLYIEIANGEMPKGGPSLNNYNQQLILKWIQQGALNN